MVETDWRQILDFAQRDLNNIDKEQLCENLSWMEADDIELNFADLKTLFRLAQDILKYKSEQVKNLHAELQISKKKHKRRSKAIDDSPSKSSDNLETLAQQEELIKSNKDILEQLYNDIAELEGRKDKLETDKVDRESDSSRDALSEINAIEQLENDVALKNRHIRKLLHDVKELEDDNLKLKEKTSVLKDKLAEATQVIEHLTEQLLVYNTENTKLKELLGKAEERKSQLSLQIETIKKDLTRKDSDKGKESDELLAKIQHWKSVAKARKSEIESLAKKNMQLQDDIKTEQQSSPKKDYTKETTLLELQEKLSEATQEILQSAKTIETLKIENRTLKGTLTERSTDEVLETELRNESDDRKQRALINQLRSKVEILSGSLKATEEALETREKELQELQTELQLLKSDEGLNKLLGDLKSAKVVLKQKDSKIKSLVQELNSMNEIISELQTENEAMRQKYNIEPNTQISTYGILKKYKDLEEDNTELRKRLNQFENLCTSLELDKHNNKCLIKKITSVLDEHGIDIKDIKDTYLIEDPSVNTGLNKNGLNKDNTDSSELAQRKEELSHIIDENEGLRKGLQEILNFLKENNASSAGVLALECPSLEAVLHSLDARHSAGWFAPHMATMCELKTALGGRDALLTALQEARKETIEVTNRLSEESQRAGQLEQKLKEVKADSKTINEIETSVDTKVFDDPDFGSWMSELERTDVDFSEKYRIDEMITRRNSLHQKHLQKGLKYFYEKFKLLLKKITELAIKASDEKNEWAIQEEHYKAQIEQLSSQVLSKEDDSSIASPGAVSIPDTLVLQRKYEYLNESYRYIRTSYDNLRNEFLEQKKQTLITNADYEVKIQKLIISNVNLTDKVRESVSMDMFCKQNSAYNELMLKYRELQNIKTEGNDHFPNLLKSLQQQNVDIISTLTKTWKAAVDTNDPVTKSLLTQVEQSILQKQVERLCEELEQSHQTITDLKDKNMALQGTQSKLFDAKINTISETEKLMRQEIKDLTDENINLREEHRKIGCKLESTVLQLQDIQQRQINNDMEINMLRHQILDLQSTSDSKAIIARLSSEVMVAHLQASETFSYIERLDHDLKKETRRRIEAEDMLMLRENIFSVYSHKYEAKFRYMFEIIQALKEQYLGSLPLLSLESYQNKTFDLNNNLKCAEEKLNEIEDLRSNLTIKHGAFNEILEIQKGKCLDEDECQHKLKFVVTQNIHSREMEYLQKKLEALEKQRKELTDHCNNLERTLVLVNQGMQRISLDDVIKYDNKDKPSKLEIEDVQSDDEESCSRKSQTITLPKPHLLKTPKDGLDKTRAHDPDKNSLPGSPIKITTNADIVKTTDVFAQTTAILVNTKNKISQTDADYQLENQSTDRINSLQRKFNKISHDLSDTMILAQRRSEEILNLNTEKESLQKKTDDLKKHVREKDSITNRLKEQIAHLNEELNHYKTQLRDTQNLLRSTTTEENKSLLMTFKKFEQEKNSIIEEYKMMLANERDEFSATTKELNRKVLDLQAQLDRRGSDSSNNGDVLKDVQEKYSVKVIQLEDECFRLQGHLDECKAEMNTYQSEAERWKELACERLAKMELLTSQLEQRHSHEVESYKAENQHWMSQYNDNQREQLELRNRLSEIKALNAKQIHEKDGAIEHLRGVINGLKTQLMSMQSVMSATDPGFDLSAIVEAEGDSEGGSNKDPDQIDFHKYESQLDVRDDSLARIPACSTAIWQEPLIDRLRREKQLCSKQNSILRRQVKALAARERRARLEAQNCRHQLYRLSTSGTKVASTEAVQLQAKIATLQEQLMHSRRDVNSHLALWDKGKRAQQAADRWQAKYEAKCVEVRKLESSLNSAKSHIARLEREKRMLMRSSENKTPRAEKHEEDDEMPDLPTRDYQHEVPTRDRSESVLGHETTPRAVPAHVTTAALMDRIEAQQRRIAALELADHGNEALVTEYERSLAEIIALKGQVLSLESTLLETQIRIPTSTCTDLAPELDYWKSYCEMLKEENIQLSTRLSAVECAPTTPMGHQQRINDLEQTVLTLRGLVSKLQAESKSSSVNLRRVDSRPNSSRTTDKEMQQLRNQIESQRIEIANLKKSTSDKDNLLERSKEMLKIAAEREETLLREITFLRRQINDYRTESKGGYLSS